MRRRNSSWASSIAPAKALRKDLAQAIGWYEKAAQEGHVMAKHNLGVMLINGMGIEADPARGARLVQEAGVVREAQAGSKRIC